MSADDSQEGITSIEVFQRLAAGWVVIVALAAIGSLIGYGLARVIGPNYQASAVLSIGFDYGRTVPLDEEALRYADERIREFLLSDEILARAAGNLPKDLPGPQDIPDLRSNLRLSQRESSWQLVMINKDPVLAAQLANAWAQAAEEGLREAAKHAWRVKELQALVSGIGCQLREDTAEGGSAMWVCDTDTFGVDPEAVLDEILEEAKLGRGILPGASFYFSQRAEAPEQASSEGRGSFVLAGLLTGLLLGTAYAAIRPARVGSAGADGGMSHRSNKERR